MNELSNTINTLATLSLGAAIAWFGDFIRDRRTRRERAETWLREAERDVTTRRWEASLAVLNQANAVYAKARDLATNRDPAREQLLRVELETARSIVTTSLSSAFLLNPSIEVREALAQVIRCCRELGDEALNQDTPSLVSLEATLKEHRTAIRKAETSLRRALGIGA